jgi:hypothetical protein
VHAIPVDDDRGDQDRQSAARAGGGFKARSAWLVARGRSLFQAWAPVTANAAQDERRRKAEDLAIP